MKSEEGVKLETFRPLGDKVFVTGIERGMSKTKGGIIMTDDNLKERGIRPRWAQVKLLGPDANHGVSVGDWVLVEHGRWTLKLPFVDVDGEITDLWMVDPKAMVLVSETDPSNERFSL